MYIRTFPTLLFGSFFLTKVTLIGPPGNDGVGLPGRQGERGEPGKPGKEKEVINMFLNSSAGIFGFVYRQESLG